MAKTVSRNTIYKRAVRRVIPISLAVAVLLLGGIITWAIIKQIDQTDNTDKKAATRLQAQVDLYELPDWHVALSLPASIASADILTTEQEDGQTGYGLTTKAGQAASRACGVTDGTLLTLRRQTVAPTLTTDQYLASTGMIGNHYYVYERTLDSASADACSEEDWNTFTSQTARMEQAVSAIQLLQ